MGRNPCCSKEGMNRGAWTAIEDKILTDYIKNNGEGKWRNIPKQAGLKRCGKSCRLRWLNYLRPDIKRGNISIDEEDLIIRLHKLLGNRWSLIAGRLPGRTDNEIKNYWNTNLAKKVQTKKPKKPRNEKNTMIKSIEPSKVVIAPKQDMPKNNCDTNLAKMAPPMNYNMVENNIGTETETSEESSLLEFKNEYFPELPMDFDIGEICISEILATDFTNDFIKVQQNDDRTMNQIDDGSDFLSLASFFESTEADWIGNDNINFVFPS